MYYRVAIQAGTPPGWQWKSTALSSLDTLFQFLRLLWALPHEQLRVFTSSSREGLEEQLVQENQGLLSLSVTAAQFLRERLILSPAAVRPTPEGEEGMPAEGVSGAVTTEHPENERGGGENVLESRAMSVLDRRREELERGPGGDHDLPYRFALPPAPPQILAWMTLLARVQQGELHSEGTWDEQHLSGTDGLPVRHFVGS